MADITNATGDMVIEDPTHSSDEVNIGISGRFMEAVGLKSAKKLRRARCKGGCKKLYVKDELIDGKCANCTQNGTIEV